ncbi:hypothetical protein ACTNDN_18420 [Niallia sp. HCP3S3_B10]|uniref:hypothetical protein n=1 Tax=Niallia sp. HCP3S3_B10 TaxID=3438944 RepID=UPI003F88A1BB
MKKILIIMNIVVLTVLLTLVILWKLDVIYLNISAPVEKSKEILGKDEVSLLLELEYPKLGEDIQVAYSLYGEPIYESNGQKDFLLLKEERETIYINYDQKEKIEAMNFYIDGAKEEIRSLGEKLLPTDSSFLDEDHEEKERKNDALHYTTTDYKEIYYYRLTEEQGYAMIMISNSITDFFGEEEEGEFPNYHVVVSKITGFDLYGVNDWDEGPLEEVKEEDHYDDVLESSESEAGELDSAEAVELDQSAALLNNEKIRHSDFLPNAKNGMIAGIDISLHDPIGSLIEDQIGQPDWRVSTEGGYLIYYDDYQAGFGVPYDYEEYSDSPINSYYLPIFLTGDEIIEYLGKPTSQDYSEVSSGYYLYYDLGEYKLFFEKNTDEPAERYYSVELRD